MKAPCYKCEQRHVSCHDNCMKYKEYRKEREFVYKKAKESVDLRGYFQDELNKNVFGRGKKK